MIEATQVRDPTDVANARRRINSLAARLAYDETQAGQLAIVVTELAQNILRHGGGGEIIAQTDALIPNGVEILALDRGPGIADVQACLRDGFSTGGTSGNGLGAVCRLAREVAFHTAPGAGTAVLVRMGGAPDLRPVRTTAALCVPQRGETVCGDGAAVVNRADGSIGIMLADGLGHGPQAAEASDQAVKLFQKQQDGTPTTVLAALHAGLRATRGAAVAVALIDPDARQVVYSGIGNIAGFITDTGGVRRMVSHSGTAGHTAGRLQDFRYPLYSRPVLAMYSDGLATSWSPESHPGLFTSDPLLIAGVLYRDHTRGRDDASVVVWKG